MFHEWVTIINNVVISDKKNMTVDDTLNFALYVGSTYNIVPIMVALGIDPRQYKVIDYSSYILIIIMRKMESLEKKPEDLLITDYEVIGKYNGNVIKIFGEDTGLSADVFLSNLESQSYINMS